MKKLIGGFVLIIPLFIAQPVFAAPLTTAQATSLVGVVQSSPETPAADFTDLITAFSNITGKQAETLIAVIQAAPGVKPDPFVQMLIAFTEDTQADKVEELETRVEVVETKIEQSSPDIGGIIEENMEDLSEILVEVEKVPLSYVNGEPVWNDASVNIPYGMWFLKVFVKNEDGSFVKIHPKDNPPSVEVTMSVDGVEKTKLIDTVEGDYKQNAFHTFQYTPQETGSKTITFTSGELIKEVTVEVE